MKSCLGMCSFSISLSCSEKRLYSQRLTCNVYINMHTVGSISMVLQSQMLIDRDVDLKTRVNYLPHPLFSEVYYSLKPVNPNVIPEVKEIYPFLKRVICKTLGISISVNLRSFYIYICGIPAQIFEKGDFHGECAILMLVSSYLCPFLHSFHLNHCFIWIIIDPYMDFYLCETAVYESLFRCLAKSFVTLQLETS
jgi:hypothetical protein